MQTFKEFKAEFANRYIQKRIYKQTNTNFKDFKSKYENRILQNRMYKQENAKLNFEIDRAFRGCSVAITTALLLSLRMF